MAGKKNVNKRGKGTSNRSWLGLLVVCILLLGAFAGLEFIRSNIPSPPAARVEVTPPPAKPVLPQTPTAAKPIQPRRSAAAKPAVAVAKPMIPPGKPGRVAIIIDDMGSSVQEAESLIGIGVPLTFSIIPGLVKGVQVAELARQHGYQVLIHLPMEPEGYPQRRLEKNGLLVSHSAEEIRQRIESYFKHVPGAVGANNHMGSRFTANSEKMRTALQVLKEHDLFFVDSVTSPQSVGYRAARELGMRAAARQVFMDNEQQVPAIRKQLLQLAAVARKRGAAIGICHPHPTTIKALQEVLPEMERSGITFVNAGDLTI